MTQQRPKVGVGVFVVKDGKFLLSERLGSHGAGTWCPPGGHLEFGESWADCARRETLEETGLHIKNIHYLTTTNDIYPEENNHYVTIIMIADHVSGQLTNPEPDKFRTQAWFDWDDFPDNLFLPIKHFREQYPELPTP